MVTGPVSKKAMHDVGFAFPGQTEFFAQRCGVSDFAMCLTGGKITVALVTAHVPLADVPRTFDNGGNRARWTTFGRLSRSSPGNGPVRIAVAGLNPHAGEGGDLGSEEIGVIAPAVRDASPPLKARPSFGSAFAGHAVLPRGCRASSMAFCACITTRA